MVFFNAPVPFNGVMEGPVNFQVRIWDISRAATFEAAITDLNLLIKSYPTAKEREAAIQQKALLLGEQNREPVQIGH